MKNGWYRFTAASQAAQKHRIDLGNRKRVVFTIHAVQTNRIRWVTRSFVSPGYRPIWMPGSDRGSDRLRSGRVFLRLAAHLNISLLRKTYWKHLAGALLRFCFLRVRETHIWRRALGGILIPHSQLGASFFALVSSPLRWNLLDNATCAIDPSKGAWEYCRLT